MLGFGDVIACVAAAAVLLLMALVPVGYIRLRRAGSSGGSVGDRFLVLGFAVAALAGAACLVANVAGALDSVTRVEGALLAALGPLLMLAVAVLTVGMATALLNGLDDFLAGPRGREARREALRNSNRDAG